MVKKVAFSSFLGNFIEWFDYASYSYFATVIALVFFPSGNHTVAMLQTFGVFALSFVLRPIGALFWGSFGDTKGRKGALAISIMFMSGASFLIGCLPSYAMIGIAAPALLLLLRMVQGFSASGEYAGAATFLGEYAPADKRGIYCSLIPASTAIGLLAGSTLATVMTSSLSSGALTAWGWRIPFLMAGPLGLVVHYIRTKLADSPVYASMTQALDSKQTAAASSASASSAANTGNVSVSPLRELFRNHFKALMISFGACVLNAVGFYTVLTYLPTYLSDTVGMPAAQSSTITTICLVLYVALVFGMGHISDTFGRKKVLIGACVAFIALTVPAFLILNTAQFWPVLIVELAMCATLTANDGTLSSYLTETFPTSVRFTGFAFSFNLANAIFGGTAPFIATWLIYATGSSIAPAWYMVAVAAVALVAMILSHENADKDLSSI
ncbi:MFS transporter [Bifidobacterium sp. 64T4]|uniref:MFS transporter n=1 Tax=Bifidobacterium pongonis TaxID=2834432 RepID=UPI001C55F86F|nr:MFS transporter [Bifidobacterium pongonis]MBW3094079.1 MFS transporter [Bifidobacterium pongonis]